ncbi:hypothetical protein F2P81_019358 [Scophthalmus maximus]|uniref:Uncharacterized protein n=1 Tax=Scophthalmus maximus TaxID=52904 RepID=A0A6A4SB03_SCOMX|nr:hypothetical protein F2P81_019358 [Scophthalmus maximus]
METLMAAVIAWRSQNRKMSEKDKIRGKKWIYVCYRVFHSLSVNILRKHLSSARGIHCKHRHPKVTELSTTSTEVMPDAVSGQVNCDLGIENEQMK